MPASSTTLPPVRLESEVSLERAIHSRRSIRSFLDNPIAVQTLGQILWAAQGMRGENDYRNAPSAGALYPLELYVVSEEAIFHYNPVFHSLISIREGDYRPALAKAALNQEFLLQAPITIAFIAVPERTINRYGPERSPRYIAIEVGHAAQNAMLQATALGLGTVAVGAFHDDQVASLLDLTEDRTVLYLVPVGYPA